MIPKIIHYCWFGRNPLPETAKKCIASWKKYCPDYEIIEWNEDNFDIPSCPLYVRQAYEAKKWAFVTDYVRLKVVYDNGGIYMDTDVELIKNLDSLLKHKAYFGFEDGKHIATGLGFGAEKGNVFVKEMLLDYLDSEFLQADGSIVYIPCPVKNTDSVMHLMPKDYTGDCVIETAEAMIFPTEYFCPLDWKTKELHINENTYSIHWYDASWLQDDQKILLAYNKTRNAFSLFLGKRIGGYITRKYYAVFYPQKWKIIKNM